MKKRDEWSRGLVGCLLAVSVVVACAKTGDTDENHTVAPPALTWDLTSLEEETIDREGTTSLTAERGTIEVPAVRRPSATRSGKESTLTVEFYRFRRAADASPDTPPIFLLKGGPGFEGMRPLLERPGYFENLLQDYVKVSDLVIVGQRGFGTSTDTACPHPDDLPPESWLDDEARGAAIAAASAVCRDHWLAEGLDLAAFNVAEAATDVHDVAQALDYEQVILWGSSFGSHLGMAVVKQHPKMISRVVFNALEGPDHTYDLAGGVQRTLARIAAAADASPTYRDRLPMGGIWAGFERQIARAEREPIVVTVEHPRTGALTDVTFSADSIRDLARGYGRRPTWRDIMPGWVEDIHRIASGDLTDAAEAILWRGGRLGLQNAAFYLYECGSGISAARNAVRLSDPAIGIIGLPDRSFDSSCPVWDADLGDAFRADFETDVPAVLVHGTWDASTPFENASEVVSFFTNGHFVVIEGGSHGAIFEAMDEPSFHEALWHFVETGDGSNLPERVSLPPIDWQVPEKS